MKIMMTARRGFRYMNRAMVAGESFEAKHERDAKLLEMLGRARRSGVAPAVAPPAMVMPEAETIEEWQQPAAKKKKKKAAEKEEAEKESPEPFYNLPMED